LHPVAEQVRQGEIDYFTRVHCYLDVAAYYPPNMMLLSLLPLSMRMAGPREILWHAIVRKNYGCTHFIVGAGHADPGMGENGKPWYPPDEGREMIHRYGKEIGIEMVQFDEMVYWEEEDTYVPMAEAPSGSRTLSLSNDQFHRKLRTSRRVPEWFTFPEVVSTIQRAYPPGTSRGLPSSAPVFQGRENPPSPRYSTPGSRKCDHAR
jgi:sulfate adenylyltransferase